MSFIGYYVIYPLICHFFPFAENILRNPQDLFIQTVVEWMKLTAIFLVPFMYRPDFEK